MYFISMFDFSIAITFIPIIMFVWTYTFKKKKYAVLLYKKKRKTEHTARPTSPTGTPKRNHSLLVIVCPCRFESDMVMTPADDPT
jgi:hypothetical protein